MSMAIKYEMEVNFGTCMVNLLESLDELDDVMNTDVIKLREGNYQCYRYCISTDHTNIY